VEGLSRSLLLTLPAPCVELPATPDVPVPNHSTSLTYNLPPVVNGAGRLYAVMLRHRNQSSLGLKALAPVLVLPSNFWLRPGLGVVVLASLKLKMHANDNNNKYIAFGSFSMVFLISYKNESKLIDLFEIICGD